MLKKWNSMSLIVRILIGLVIGVILGLAFPGLRWIRVLGTLFVGALKGIAPLLVFVLVASSLANAKGGNMSRFRTVIFLYLFSTLCAAVVAVFVNFAFPVTISLDGMNAAQGYVAPTSMSEILMNFLTSVVANPVDALANGDYIGILFWAVSRRDRSFRILPTASPPSCAGSSAVRRSAFSGWSLTRFRQAV